MAHASVPPAPPPGAAAGAGPTVLHRLDCPRCGAAVPRLLPQSQTLVCRQCRGVLAEGPEGLVFSPGSRLPRPRLPVTLGARLRLDGAEQVVLGRVHYRGWDPGEPNESWSWDEWLLGGPDGRMSWLALDEKGLSVFRRNRFAAPFRPGRDRSVRLLGVGDVPIRETYRARVTGVEGELTSRLRQGDELTVAEGGGDRLLCSVQATEHELGCYRGRRLSDAEVEAAFGRGAARTARPPRPLGLWVGLLLLGAGLLALLAAGVTAATGRGTTVLAPTAFALQRGTAVSVPVELAHPGRPVRLDLRLLEAMPLNTSNDLSVTVTSPDGTDTLVAVPEFWNETGVDDEGRWQEAQTRVRSVFVPAQRGRHDIELELDEAANLPAATVQVTARDRFLWPTPWLVAAGVLGIPGALVLLLTAARAGWLPEGD